jgi:hypothetical protein
MFYMPSSILTHYPICHILINAFLETFGRTTWVADGQTRVTYPDQAKTEAEITSSLL